VLRADACELRWLFALLIAASINAHISKLKKKRGQEYEHIDTSQKMAKAYAPDTLHQHLFSACVRLGPA
jgi:hypothetical protein